MHQPIRDHLEAYLSDSSDPAIPQEFHAHLAACSSCGERLQVVAGQTRLLRTFRGAGQLEPSAGFYARVLNRIDEQRPDSFWSVFLGPVFGNRLTYACAALVLGLGTYLVTSEPGNQVQAPALVVSETQRAPDLDGTVQPKDRDAVLVNLASFRE